MRFGDVVSPFWSSLGFGATEFSVYSPSTHPLQLVKYCAIFWLIGLYELNQTRLSGASGHKP